VADQDAVFNPLDSETQESAIGVPGIKRPGEPLETHEATYIDTHLIELDLDRYIDDFNRRVIGAYQEGQGSAVLPADLGVARSLVPPGTGALRDFSYIAPEIPEFDFARCVGCMTCVTSAQTQPSWAKRFRLRRSGRGAGGDPGRGRTRWVRSHWARTRKCRCSGEKGDEGALFGILSIPPSARVRRCVGGMRRAGLPRSEDAPKSDKRCPLSLAAFNMFRKIGPTPKKYINEKP
jgi:hypothetical protein